MNSEGGPYVIANSKSFDTEKLFLHEAEHFDVYSHLIETLYSEVHWRMHYNISLPENIVERFSNRGKVMAILGYEIDQIEEGTGNKIPISWAYNHHYGAFLSNHRKIAIVKKKITPQAQAQGMGHGGPHYWAPKLLSTTDSNVEHGSGDPGWKTEIPHFQWFSEGNGGEMRKSFHGYPKGYAQLIQSPDTFSIIPMQIDTWDRERMKNATYVPCSEGNRCSALRPASSPNTALQKAAPYNPLLECPCSNRVPKEWNMSYDLSIFNRDSSSDDPLNPACVAGVENSTECFNQALHAVIPEALDDFTTHSFPKHNDAWPTGCSILVNAQDRANTIAAHGRAMWNPSPPSHVAASNHQIIQQHYHRPRKMANPSSHVSFARGPGINVTVKLTPSSLLADIDEPDDGVATIELVGPADFWFGIGFGTNSMCTSFEADECPGGGPYAIIVLGDHVEERRLDFHGPGRVLATDSLETVVNNVEGDTRTVVLKRRMATETKDFYSFPDPLAALPAALDIPIILARGCSHEFAQHCGHGPSNLVFLPTKAPATVCRAGLRGLIGGNEFDNHRCGAFPLSTLEEHKNPTCRIQTYSGGLSCCRDGQSLLDKEQEQPWPNHKLKYRLKFRFYFQEYKPATSSSAMDSSTSVSPASHKQLLRFYHQTEAWAGEYDIPMASKNDPPEQHVHVITSRWKVQDMLFDCDLYDATICTGTGSRNSSQTAGIKLIYAGPHCHAGTCLSMELYNADTGQLLCGMQPIYGKNSSETYNEEHFLAIPPCLWSETGQDGLPRAELLTLNTTLWSIKRSNNTFPHTGEMASWQMRGILVAAGDLEAGQKNTNDGIGHSLDRAEVEEYEASPIRPLLRSAITRDGW